MSGTTEKEPVEKFNLKQWVMNWYPAILIGLFLLNNAGILTLEQVEEIKRVVVVKDGETEEPTPDIAPAPKPLTPEDIAEIIRRSLKENTPEPVEEEASPNPAPVPAPPIPVEPVRVRVVDQDGEEITSGEVEAGLLFRVSATGCGDDIGWHPVKSGDVRLSASTDGKEFCGYLTAGQWVEFSLTDFNTKKQASLRVTCLTAPQPPPDDDVKPAPKPEPKAKNVRIFVVYNPNKMSPEASMVLNANDMWDQFTANGNDWQWIDIETEDEFEKQVIADCAGESLPAVAIYEKATNRKLTAEPLPKSVIATEGLVERYTGGR